MAKEIIFSDEARNKLAVGVQKLCDAVKVTMGPRGRNVLIQKSYGSPVITKDGVSVAREIELKDRLENMGAQLVKEVASRTADEAGDGTTTATVLANAIFSEGLRNITAGANPIEVKRGMDKAKDAIIQELIQSAKKIENRVEITQIATISANSDIQIGEMIAEAMSRVTLDGVITVEEAKGIYDELIVVEGTKFDKGYLSPHFVTNKEKMTVELDNPYILFCDHRILGLHDILPILEEVQKTQRPLLIVAEEIESESLSTLVLNKLRGALNVTAVKAPGYGEKSKSLLSDMCVLTQGTLITEDTGKSLASCQLSDLGQCAKVIISKDSTTIVDGFGDPKLIKERVQEIRTLLTTSKEGYETNLLKERLSKMSGGVAVIKVGANSETEMKERKDRIDDALSATKAAMEEGIVIGGGCALIRASAKVNLNLTGDQKIGADIIQRAIKAPLRQISENAGFDSGVVINTVLKKNKNIGFDASTGKYVDMFEAGIIDPLKVERVALTNAVSVAIRTMTDHDGQIL